MNSNTMTAEELLTSDTIRDDITEIFDRKKRSCRMRRYLSYGDAFEELADAIWFTVLKAAIDNLPPADAPENAERVACALLKDGVPMECIRTAPPRAITVHLDGWVLGLYKTGESGPGSCFPFTRTDGGLESTIRTADFVRIVRWFTGQIPSIRKMAEEMVLEYRRCVLVRNIKMAERKALEKAQ